MRTISASLSMMTSLRSCTRYPSGGTPPIHIPFCFEAAILSRMRSPMTSRSNCAKDNSTLEGQAPHRCRRVELLRDRDKGGAPGVEDLDDLGEIGERAGQAVDFVDDDRVDPSCRDVGEQPLQSRPAHRRAGEPTVIIPGAQAHPAFVALASDKGLAGLALRLQRIEFLFEPLLGGFAGVDCAANPRVPLCVAAGCSRHRPALAPAKARARLVRPKNRGPDQWASVIRSAIAVSDR